MDQKPKGLSQIISKTGIDSGTMKEYLVLLLERHYVEESSIEDKSSYMITPRGISVVRYFEEIQKYPSLKIFENYLRTKE